MTTSLATKYMKPGREPLEEWRVVCRDVGRQARIWAGRNDIIAYVASENTRTEAPAAWMPKLSEMELNNARAFGKGVTPADIGDFTDRGTHYRFPIAAGAVLHEAMHAAHTTFDFDDARNAVGPTVFNRTFMLLEELRIERYGVLRYPQNRVFLKASAMEFAVSTDDAELAQLSLIRQFARVAVLALGRVTIGVLEDADVERTKIAIDKVFAPNTLDKMTSLWKEFTLQDCDRDSELKRMYEIAIEFDALVEKISTAAGDPEDGTPPDLPQWLIDMLKELMKASGRDAFDTQVNARQDIADEQQDERDQKSVAQKNADARERADADKTATKNIHERSIGPNGTNSNSRLTKRRPPTEAERTAAVTIGKALQKARYRDRLVVERMTENPPGRLRTTVAMHGAANKAMGMRKRTEPFRSRGYRTVEDPNLTVGIMCDVSGSMGSTMEPMGIATWVIQEAVRRVQGRAAAIYYGNAVFPTLKPGQHQKDVVFYSAQDGSEAFDEAFKSIDGALSLLHGNGARLLVNVSDGNYRANGQAQACEKWLARCKAMGVAVVWLGLKAGLAQEICERHGAKYVYVGDDVMAAANAIGKACTEALTKASR